MNKLRRKLYWTLLTLIGASIIGVVLGMAWLIIQEYILLLK